MGAGRISCLETGQNKMTSCHSTSNHMIHGANQRDPSTGEGQRGGRRSNVEKQSRNRLCKQGSHKPSPETLSCCSVSPPDGFIFRGLEYIRFSGDPAQVSDLEEAKI